MHYRIAALAIAVCGFAPAAASAQTPDNDRGAFYALIFTPIGALPSAVRASSPGDSGSHGVVSFLYGRYKFRDDTLTFNNFGVAGQLRVFRRLSLGATIAHRGCGDVCEGLTMASVDAFATLLHHKGTEPGAGDTEIGMQLSAGYGKPAKTSFTTQSATLMLPLIVTLPQSNDGVLILSLLPGAAYGRLIDDAGVVVGSVGTFGAMRFLIGAGFGYLFPVGLGVHVGVHRIAIEESTTQSGLGLSWRF